MTAQRHQYAARLVWTGNTGQGTATYTGYGREYTVAVDGKPDLLGSSDPAFRGDPTRHNPEDLFRHRSQRVTCSFFCRLPRADAYI